MIRISHNTWDNLGNYDAALEYHQKSLDPKLELYDENHTEMAQSYGNMATTFSNMER